jgi:hypothetical protein
MNETNAEVPLVRTQSIRFRFGAQVPRPQPEVLSAFPVSDIGQFVDPPEGEGVERVDKLVDPVHRDEAVDYLGGVAVASGIKGVVRPFESKGFYVDDGTWTITEQGVIREPWTGRGLCVGVSFVLILAAYLSAFYHLFFGVFYEGR